MKPIFQLIAKDSRQTQESWSWIAVIALPTGLDSLEHDPECPESISEGQIQEILHFLATNDIHVRGAGNSGPGQPFADEPWVQFYPNLIVVSQHGGLDV